MGDVERIGNNARALRAGRIHQHDADAVHRFFRAEGAHLIIGRHAVGIQRDGIGTVGIERQGGEIGVADFVFAIGSVDALHLVAIEDELGGHGYAGSDLYKADALYFILYQDINVAIYALKKGHLDVLDSSISANYAGLFTDEANIDLFSSSVS